jgi:hypothetical protein
LRPDSEDLTTGSYKYRVVLFGLTNGLATLQRFINDNFFDCLDDFLTAYLDDLLIYSDNELDHEIHVKNVLALTSKERSWFKCYRLKNLDLIHLKNAATLPENSTTVSIERHKLEDAE